MGREQLVLNPIQAATGAESVSSRAARVNNDMFSLVVVIRFGAKMYDGVEFPMLAMSDWVGGCILLMHASIMRMGPGGAMEWSWCLDVGVTSFGGVCRRGQLRCAPPMVECGVVRIVFHRWLRSRDRQLVGCASLQT